MLLLGLGPPTEHRLDGEELHLGKLGGELGRDLGIAGAIEMLGRQPLTFIAVEVLEVGLSHLGGTLALDHPIDPGDRRLGEDAGRG